MERYCLPVPQSRRNRASLGYTLLPGLLNEIHVKPFIDPRHVAFSATSPEAIMRIADVLKRCHAAMAPAQAELLGSVEDLLGGLHRHYFDLVADSLRSSRKFVATELLIRCLTFAGFLRDTHDFKPAVRQALEATIANKDHRIYCLDRLDSGYSDLCLFRFQKSTLMETWK